MINLEIGEHLNYKLILTDLVGKQILELNNKSQINVSHLVDGIYLLTIIDMSSNQQIIEKIQIKKAP